MRWPTLFLPKRKLCGRRISHPCRDREDAILSTKDDKCLEAVAERRRGRSKLVYDKARRTIITVRTPWWRRALQFFGFKNASAP